MLSGVGSLKHAGKIFLEGNAMCCSGIAATRSRGWEDPLAREKTRERGVKRVRIAKLAEARSLGTEWNLSPDGRRLAVVTPMKSLETAKQDHEIVMLENFFDELEKVSSVSRPPALRSFSGVFRPRN
jgi:hypothetical protein